MKDALTELLPRKARLALYVIAGLGSLGLAAWQAAEGNWALFVGGLLSSLVNVLAAGNITPPEAWPVTEEEEL